MERLAGRTLFLVGSREYGGEDLALAAQLWGDAAEEDRRAREGIASLRHLGDGLSEAEVDEAMEAWRYERDLLSGDDVQAWLAARGLELDEWIAYINRSVARRHWSEGLAKRYKVSADQADAVVYSEAVCSGRLTELAERLAGRAAIHDRDAGEGEPSAAEIRAVLKRLPAAVKRNGILGLGPKETLKRAEFVARATISFDRFRDRVAAPAALEREIESHTLEWTRLDCESVTFAAEEPAREATLLVREDGLPLAKVAAMAKSTVQRAQYVLEDVAQPLKDRLVGALPGELIGPLSGNGFTLLSVLDRVEPSTRERAMLQRAEDRVVRRAIQREVLKRVRWHERI